MSVRLVTSDIESNKAHTNGFSNERHGGNGGGGMDQRLAVLEAKVAHIESDVTDLKSTVGVIDKNTAVILERLDGIKESLAKKPSLDAVDKKIADAKVSQIIWTIGSVLAIVSIASGIIIKILHS
ncbi:MULTISPECIES: hypothetical protein [Klebsiella]|uniref:hypothetical protein n=1 Tax=Klebsiella TaxID=570 RepID=UPI001D0D5A57|nr:hypothetical protein [Klebsiella aerogenes]